MPQKDRKRTPTVILSLVCFIELAVIILMAVHSHNVEIAHKADLGRLELQSRLQSILDSFEEIERSRVTIHPAAADSAMSASVSIRLNAGRAFSREQQDTVSRIVTMSVPGLDEENVAVSINSDPAEVILYDISVP